MAVAYEFVDKKRLIDLVAVERIYGAETTMDQLGRVILSLQKKGDAKQTRPRAFNDFYSKPTYYVETCLATKFLLKSEDDGVADIILWYSPPIGDPVSNNDEYRGDRNYPSSLFLIQDHEGEERGYIASNCSILTRLYAEIGTQLAKTECGRRIELADEYDFVRDPISTMQSMGAVATRMDTYVTFFYKRLSGTVWDKLKITSSHRKGDQEIFVIGYVVAVAEGSKLFDEDDVENERVKRLKDNVSKKKEEKKDINRKDWKSVFFAVVTGVLLAVVSSYISTKGTATEIIYRCRLYIRAEQLAPSNPNFVEFKVTQHGNGGSNILWKNDYKSFLKEKVGEETWYVKDIPVVFSEKMGITPELRFELTSKGNSYRAGYYLYRDGGSKEFLIKQDETDNIGSLSSVKLKFPTSKTIFQKVVELWSKL